MIINRVSWAGWIGIVCDSIHNNESIHNDRRANARRRLWLVGYQPVPRTDSIEAVVRLLLGPHTA